MAKTPLDCQISMKRSTCFEISVLTNLIWFVHSYINKYTPEDILLLWFLENMPRNYKFSSFFIFHLKKKVLSCKLVLLCHVPIHAECIAWYTICTINESLVHPHNAEQLISNYCKLYDTTDKPLTYWLSVYHETLCLRILTFMDFNICSFAI